MTSQHKYLPRVEALEDRAVPAVVINQVGNTINITGDATAERIRVEDNGTNALAAIRVFDDVTNLPLFASALLPNGQAVIVIIDLKDGNDTARYLLTNDLDSNSGANPTGGRIVFGLMGKGNDRFAFSATRPNDAPGLRLDNALLRVEAYGYRGDDNLSMTYRGQATAGSLTFLANGMLNNDRILLSETLQAGSTGSTALILDGGPGSDVMIGLLSRDQNVNKNSATINGQSDGDDRAFFSSTEVQVFGVPEENQVPILD